jgi:hypothetical protein
MLALEFFTWWYSQGWLKRWQGIITYAHKTSQAFSTRTLVRTLFEPWRRIISYPGAGLSNHLRATFDNLFSRIIGFCVRVIVITFSGILLVFIMLIGTSVALIWPFIPFIALALLIKGVF